MESRTRSYGNGRLRNIFGNFWSFLIS